TSSATGAIVPFASPAANDLVDGAVAVTCAPQGGSLFPLGTTTVTCVAMDRAGNSAQAGFTVSVAQTPLLAPPVLHLPRPIRAEATSRAGARVVYTASASVALFPRRSVPIVCMP